MTRRAHKTAAVAVRPETDRPARRGRWRVVVDNSRADAALARSGTGSATAAEDHISAARLAAAARAAPRVLPYRADLERLFGQPLNDLHAVDDRAAEAALDAAGADAATVGERIVLRPGAPLPTVAHEVAHVLQKRGIAPVATDVAAAEAEATAAERRVAADRAVPAVTARLTDDIIAFRGSGAPLEAGEAPGRDAEAATAFRSEADATTTEANGPDGNTPAARNRPEPAAPAAPAAAGNDGRAPLFDADATLDDIPDDPVPTFEPAAMPEIAAEDDGASAAASEALTEADDSDDLMAAFRTAPPSVKAARHDRLEADADRLAGAEQAAFDAAMPQFEAQMSGTDDLAAPAPVAAPDRDAGALDDDGGGVAPEPAVEPTPEAQRAALNDAIRSVLAAFFGAADPAGLGQTFARVSTTDDAVDTSAGARPEIPLEGSADPARVGDQDRAARNEARASRQEATAAVLDGPGPETVTLAELRETFAPEAREVPGIGGAQQALDGPAAFREKDLDPDVVVLFDRHHDAAMADSLAGAEAATAAAVESRDTDRDAELAAAEAERNRLNAEADENQRAEVTERRQQVQDARQEAVDTQARHVADLETEAVGLRRDTEAEIEAETAATDAQVAADFAVAEERADAQVVQGETRAEEKRREEERSAENQSWWDRATDWVAAQFDRLTKFINDIFDAVRAAVKGIIDAVKAAALALITLAAAAITAAIARLGEALKAGVNALLAEHFPAVAAALNGAIDHAVQAATDAVNIIADALKAGISALLDALAAGIDAILAAYQAAMNAALAIARAALTGDWAELARLILEPVLYALGIEPAAFYQTIGRAIEALDIIVDDPLGFLSNLLDAVTGGIRRFAENLLAHLQAGVIAWLTGAFGGAITLPAEWSLWAVLDIARQVLGLTVDMLRRVAVRVLGEAAVERIEFFMGYVGELLGGGWSALWDRIAQDLGNLKDMVLDQIRSFLVTRIVMAAVTWLASMFSPVGALIKVVMTIWNFLMFLKDQLTRIIEVATTVINTIWEIANRVLDPAIRGVEGVLARLLPIVIDLLARLLGLGNVAGRVQRIVQDVQQRIEDAIVRLIERVLARFTGRGDGAEGAVEDEGATGDLMTPIAFGSDDQRHTLYLEPAGQRVVPMMRSTPTPVQDWIESLRGAGLDRIGAAKSPPWSDEDVASKRREIEPLVTAALAEEADLDRVSDEAAATGTPAPQAPGAVAEEGRQLAGALTGLIAALGLQPAAIETTFATEIEALGPLRDSFVQGVLPPMRDRAARLAPLDWRAAVALTLREAGGDLPAAWRQPAASAGLLRTTEPLNAQFRAEIVAMAVAETRTDRLSGDAGAAELDHLLHHYLTATLNRPPAVTAIQSALLEGRNGGDIARAVEEDIKDAARRRYGNELAFDHAFHRVTGSFYRTELIPQLQQATPEAGIGRADFGTYFEDEAENTAGSGSSGRPMSLFAFLGHGSAPSRRVGANRSRMADAVRGASPGQHEWIASRFAATVVTRAADAIAATGSLDPLKGAAELLQFQHQVRTPTRDLIFAPGSGYPAGEVTVTYKARPHREHPTLAGTPMTELPEDLRAAWYPARHPQEGNVVGVLQGHPGAIYAFAHGGSHSQNITQQIVGHSEWDRDLAGGIETRLASGAVAFRDVQEIGQHILNFYQSTIWSPARAQPRAASGRFFPIYYRARSETAAVSYHELEREVHAEFTAVYDRLRSDIDSVTRS